MAQRCSTQRSPHARIPVNHGPLKRRDASGWTPEELLHFVEVVESLGPVVKGFHWVPVSKALALRDVVKSRGQCCKRWKTLIVNGQRADWTPAEDALLWTEQARVGRKWTDIAATLVAAGLPPRTGNGCKNRHLVLLKRGGPVPHVGAAPAAAAVPSSPATLALSRESLAAPPAGSQAPGCAGEGEPPSTLLLPQQLPPGVARSSAVYMALLMDEGLLPQAAPGGAPRQAPPSLSLSCGLFVRRGDVAVEMASAVAAGDMAAGCGGPGEAGMDQLLRAMQEAKAEKAWRASQKARRLARSAQVALAAVSSFAPVAAVAASAVQAPPSRSAPVSAFAVDDLHAQEVFPAFAMGDAHPQSPPTFAMDEPHTPSPSACHMDDPHSQGCNPPAADDSPLPRVGLMSMQSLDQELAVLAQSLSPCAAGAATPAPSRPPLRRPAPLPLSPKAAAARRLFDTVTGAALPQQRQALPGASPAAREPFAQRGGHSPRSPGGSCAMSPRALIY